MKKHYVLGAIALVAFLGIVIGATRLNPPKQKDNDVQTPHTAAHSTSTTPEQTVETACTSTYCIQSNVVGETLSANTPVDYTFSIVDRQSVAQTNFAITHTKPMHVIIVRDDLSSFQHLHPEFDETGGVFRLRGLTLPEDGVYRIFADFALAEGTSATLWEDVSIGKGTESARIPIGTEARKKTFDGIETTLSTDGPFKSGEERILTFHLERNGTVVTDLEEVLGALGHAVILREGTLDFIHAHPLEKVRDAQSGNVRFAVRFPEFGTYKIFTQFQRDGKIILTDYVVSVTRGAETTDDAHGHSGH